MPQWRPCGGRHFDTRAEQARVGTAAHGREPSIGGGGSRSSAVLRYSPRMAPTIVRDGQFRLFFFSREETRIHVHVAHPDGEAKFWLTPDVNLAVNIGLSPAQLRQAQAVVTAHLQEIEDAWRRHFGS